MKGVKIFYLILTLFSIKDSSIDQIINHSIQMSKDLLNVQVYAFKELSDYESLSYSHSENAENLSNLTFLGMLGISDDLKAREAISLQEKHKKMIDFKIGK
jgi:magnesium-transporting ATPase (P-type)